MLYDMSNRILPQLVMVKKDLSVLPCINIPTGYTLRTFEPGDEMSWENIINEAFGNIYDFGQLIKSNDYFRPGRVFFVCFEGIPVATATAWFVPKWGENCGYLHMVGSRLDHRGNNLGLQVSLAALSEMANEGRNSAILQTDDFRLAAIKIYIKLGFRPLLVHENQQERWLKILSSLGIDNSIVLEDESQ